MAKSDIKGNNKSSKNINILKDRFKGKRILIISTSDKDVKISKELSWFFDIIIIEGFLGLAMCPQPDVFIDTSMTPYENHCFKESRYKGLDNSLICADIRNLKEMKKAHYKHNNYLLSCLLIDNIVTTNNANVVDKIKFGINKNEPGVHLAKIGGAEEIYSTYNSCFSVYLNLNEIVKFITDTEKLKYGTKIKNLIRANRGLYLEENGI